MVYVDQALRVMHYAGLFLIRGCPMWVWRYTPSVNLKVPQGAGLSISDIIAIPTPCIFCGAQKF